MYYFFKGKFFRNKPQDGLVFLQFDEVWKSQEFTDAKLAIEAQKLSLTFFEREWILLKKNGSIFEQQGPFSSHEIFEMLKNSSLSSEAHIWRRGFSQWKKISGVDVFCELFGNQVDSQKQWEQVQNETADILENIMEMQRVVTPKDDKNFCTDEDAVLL